MPSLTLKPTPKAKSLYRQPLVKNGSDSIGISEYARFVAELLDSAKRFQKLDQWKAELPAAATHWLLSGGESDDILGREFRSVWREFIADYGINGYNSRIADGDQLVLPFGITLAGVPFPPPVKPLFTFIDLFAGIGGFRMALQRNGGRGVFSSEWDKHAQETYYNNFGEYPFGDIRQFIKESVADLELKKLIADYDVLAVSFQLN